MPKKSFAVIASKKIRSFKKVIQVDSDKSISIRSFLIGAISHNISQIKNVLDNAASSTKFSDLFCGKTISLDTLKFFENDFESVVFPTYPEIGVIKSELIALGAKFASLSGSGSTVFGIFDDNARISKAFSHFSPMHKTHIADPV